MAIEALQTADACVGICTCIIKICQFAINFKEAGNAAKDTLERVQHVHRTLEEVRRTLRVREWSDELHRTSQGPARETSNVRRSMRKCESTLKAIMTAIYGEAVSDADVVTEQKIRKAKLAFFPNELIRLRDSLALDMSSVQISVQNLTMYDTSSLRRALDRNSAKQDRNHQEHMQELRNFERLISEGRQQQSAPRPSRMESRPSSDADSAIDIQRDLQPSEEDLTRAQGSRQNLSERLRDATETYDLFRSTFGVIEPCQEDMPDDGLEMARVDSRIDHQSPHHGITRVSYPDRLNDDIVRKYKGKARAEQAAQQWTQAWRSTQYVIDFCQDCERSHGRIFDDVLELYEMLVDILVHLDWWNEAFYRIGELQDVYPVPGNGEAEDLRPEIASINHLKASVYFDRYHKSNDTPENDLEEAHRLSKQAFAVFQRNTAIVNGDDVRFAKGYKECARLHIHILLELDHQPVAEEVRRWIDGTSPGLLADTDTDIARTGEEIMRDTGGRTPLMQAIIKKDLTNAFTLLRSLSEANASMVDNNGYTPLHHAAEQGNPRIINKLLRHAPDIDARIADNTGATPLYLAVMNGHEQAARTLIAAGADLRLRFAGGVRLLHKALTRELKHMVVMLLESGGSEILELGDDSNRTALHDAVEKEKIEQVQILFDYGANANAKTTAGNPPLALALENRSPETLINLLLDNQAVVDEDILSPGPRDNLKAYLTKRRKPSLGGGTSSNSTSRTLNTNGTRHSRSDRLRRSSTQSSV